jgi:hypothetical protein
VDPDSIATSSKFHHKFRVELHYEILNHNPEENKEKFEKYHALEAPVWDKIHTVLKVKQRYFFLILGL